MGAVAVAIMLLAPCGVAFAEDAPPVDQPVVEVPVVEPPSDEAPVEELPEPPLEIPPVPDSPENNPPLPSEVPIEQESHMPEGEHDWGPTPQPTEAPLTGIWAMSDADRFAYLTAGLQERIQRELEQLYRDNGGKFPSGITTFPDPGDSAKTLGTTPAGEPWTELAPTVVDRPSRSSGADANPRALSERLTIQYETPRTTEIAFVVTNASARSTTVAISWRSESDQVSDRVVVAAGATVQGAIALPRLQDVAGTVGDVTATFTSPASAGDEISFVALASPVAPLGFPDSRGYATRTR